MSFTLERIFKGPGFAETLFLGTCGKQRILRKSSNPDALSFSRTALIREIRLLSSLDGKLKPFFPELIRTNLNDCDEDSPDIPDVIYYDMPYYSPDDGWAALSGLLLDNTISKENAKLALGEILDTAFMYFRLDEKEPDSDYVEKTMFRAIRESIAWARSDSYFTRLCALKDVHIAGRPVKNVNELDEYFQDTSLMRGLLIPFKDRFLHGDFFPENILYNSETGRWILLDPVSVRGVHRGDFILDINKMDDWLSGELPALRFGQFTVSVRGSDAEYSIHSRSGKLENLHRNGLFEWYRERLKKTEYADVFAGESGWELRWKFIKAFYAFCMLPLAERRQAEARYFLALDSMADFIERAGV